MSDKDTVIEALDHCIKYGSLSGQDCNGHYEYTDNLELIIKANNHRIDCPYGTCKTGCVITLAKDAAELLRNPETVKPKKIKGFHAPYYVQYSYECPECTSQIITGQPYCAGCGKKVEWDDT